MTEPWIRVHANLYAKPVIGRAVDTLKVSPNEAIGLLVRLWGALSQHGDNGRLTDLPDSQLESWAGWRGKRGKFAAFIRDKHTDPDGRIREWDDYAGPLETRRRKDRDRKRKSRGGHADSPEDVTRTSALTRANETKRNDTIRETTNAVADTREPVGVLIGPPILSAMYATIWANGAITERWGERPSPLTVGSHAQELADDLIAIGVEWEIAKASIYRQCRESKNEKPPRTVNYFRAGIEDDWRQEQARRTQAVSGETPPPRAAQRPGIGGRAYLTTLDAIKDM